MVLAGAPEGFDRTLGVLPEGVRLRRHNAGRRDLTLWFTRKRKDLENGIRGATLRAGDGPLWILWPKQAAATASDLTEAQVQQAGLGIGWVDYKVCAVDRTWSGLLFRRRQSPLSARPPFSARNKIGAIRI